jgi:hypothetical protein
VSSRRSTSLVVALGVAALAGTSLAAMVATSELLVESFGRPVSGRLDPPLPDLGGPNVIQVEPPEPGRVGRPGGRSGAAEGGPPPRRRSPAGAGPEADGGGVVVAVQRRPARQERVAVREPALDRPAIPVTLPGPEPAERPRRPRHTRPWKRWTGPRPHRDPRVRVPVAPEPSRPRPADPGDDPGGWSPCPDHPRRHGDHHRRDQRRHRRDGDGSRGHHDRRRHDEHRHRWDKQGRADRAQDGRDPDHDGERRRDDRHQDREHRHHPGHDAGAAAEQPA